jgi:hypothetical protein
MRAKKPPHVIKIERTTPLRLISGSDGEDFSNILVSQVVNSLWLKHSDSEERARQINAAITAMLGTKPRAGRASADDYIVVDSVMQRSPPCTAGLPMLTQYERLLNALPEITRHEQPSARDDPAAVRKRSSATPTSSTTEKSTLFA